MESISDLAGGNIILGFFSLLTIIIITVGVLAIILNIMYYASNRRRSFFDLSDTDEEDFEDLI